jgi:hypothetical protein
MRPYGREVGGGTVFLVPLLFSYAFDSLEFAVEQNNATKKGNSDSKDSKA